MKKGFKITSFVLLAILITTLLCISILHYNKEFTSDDVNVAYANGLSVGEVASEKALSSVRTEFNSADETLRNEFTSADEELRTLINTSSPKTYYSHYVTIHFNWRTMTELPDNYAMALDFTIINQSSEAFTLETLYQYFADNFNDSNKKYINANSDIVRTRDAGFIVERKMNANTNANIKKISVQFQIIKFELDESNVLTSKASTVSYYVTEDNVIQDNVVAL